MSQSLTNSTVPAESGTEVSQNKEIQKQHIDRDSNGQEDDNDNGSENISTSARNKSSGIGAFLRRIWEIINWVPPSCRHDPENPREFTLALNLLFGFAGTFTVRSLCCCNKIHIVVH